MPTLTPTPIMPIVLLLLLLLPMKLSSLQLKGLAFFLWLVGGLVLIWRGVIFLFFTPDAHPDQGMLIGVVVAALAIGFAKGKFVLTKTSQRNIERLDALTEPQRPVMVYSIRSWIVIGVMVGICVLLNVLNVDPFWRGAVNLGIGMGLIVSSLIYLKALAPVIPPPSAES